MTYMGELVLYARKGISKLKENTMRKKIAVAGIGVMFAILLPATTHAASINWDNGGVGNEWLTAENWGGDSVPGGSDNALFNMSGADAGYLTSGAVNPGRLYLGSNFGDTGELYISGGTLNAGLGYSGRYGTGIVNQSGGSASFSDTVYLGTDDGSTRDGNGTWILSGGTLDVGKTTGNALEIGRPVDGATGMLNISGGTLLTGEQLVVRQQGTLVVSGADASITIGGSAGAGTAEYRQLAGGVLDLHVAADGLSTIVLDDAASGTVAAIFDSGSVLNVDFIGADSEGTWTVMEVEGADITDGGLVFADTVDQSIWSFNVDNSGANGVLTVTAIPEPATLGMVALFGGGILFIRRRFMI